jgi:hypothetical protein
MSALYFFTDKEVYKHATKKTKAVLSKIGAFTRRTAKQLIKKVNKKGTPSKPGQPPKDRGGPLKKMLYFFFDLASLSVVIGPAKLRGMVSDKALPSLEYGGNTRIKESDEHSGKRTIRTVHLAARPFMGPAGKKEQAKAPALWKSAIH